MLMHYHKFGHHKYHLSGFVGADTQNDTATAAESVRLNSINFCYFNFNTGIAIIAQLILK